MVTTRKRVSYTRMEDMTLEDLELMMSTFPLIKSERVDKILELLKDLDDDDHNVAHVTRFVHSLQTATRAYEDGADEETIVAALLHDVGDNVATIMSEDHSEIAARILRPFVSEKTHWVVQHHGIFQGYYYLHHFGSDRNLRDKFKSSPHYQDCVDFCHKYDQVAFDPNYEFKPLEFFEPMVRRIFAREPKYASTSIMAEAFAKHSA